MPNPKTLAEVMKALQENPENNASQDNAFEYLQEKERGTASAEAQIAQDVLNLIKEVQDRVYAKNGVKLYPEVRIMGEQ